MEKKIFENNPKLEVLYKTTDGNYFGTELHAKRHADTLKEKKIEVIKKDQKKKQEEKEINKIEKNVSK